MASTNNIQWDYLVNAPRPLDKSFLFESLEDAQTAAATAFLSGTEVAESAGNPYYIGQVISVATETGVGLYQIQPGEKDANGYLRGSSELKKIASDSDIENVEIVSEVEIDEMFEN